MTVQATGGYTFRVFGAQGGSAMSRTNVFGGKGAQADCTVTLTVDTMLKILVGQQGTSAANYGDGGGGTYVTLADNTLLCIAGGGSGSNPGRGVVAGATGVLTGSALAPIAAGTVYYGPAANSSTYGTVAAGSSVTRNVAIYNTSGQTLTGSAYYSITSTTCASTLATGSSCTVSVRYAPTVADTSSTLVSMDVPGVGTVSGKVFGKVFGSTSETLVYGEVNESYTPTLTAPQGKTLGEVVFTSYGTPAGTTGATYVAGSCHAKTSLSLATTAFTGKTTGSLAASNTNFGDPCSGTSKSMAVAVRVY